MKKLMLIIAFVALIAAPAFSHCGVCAVGEAKGSKGSMHEGKAKGMMEKMMENLGLSDEQVEKINALKKEKMKKKQAAHDEFKAKLKEILSEEQMNKYEEMKGKHHDHKGSMMEHKGSKGSDHENHKGHDHDHGHKHEHKGSH